MASDLAPSVIVADNDGDDLSPITDEVPGSAAPLVPPSPLTVSRINLSADGSD